MFNRVPADDRADENQAESAHKVPKMTLTMAELADELHISLPSAGWMVSRRLLLPEFFRKMYLPRAVMCAMIIVAP